MRLPFFKRLSIQTKYSPEKVKQIFPDTINDPLTWRYAGVNRILTDDWIIWINFNNDSFQITIRPKIFFLLKRSLFLREGLRTILKGRLRENTNNQGTLISMIIRPSDEDIVLLSFVFTALIAAFVYAISSHNTELLIISSILVFAWWIGFLMIFNSQVRVYKRIIDRCFN